LVNADDTSCYWNRSVCVSVPLVSVDCFHGNLGSRFESPTLFARKYYRIAICNIFHSYGSVLDDGVLG
jgi:hypothetical protein